MSSLLQVRQLSVAIGGHPVCEGLDLDIDPGQSWALLGRNGAGKTTLIHHLAGLRSGHTGRILLAGQDIAALAPRARARQIGILLQHSNAGFGASVLDTVLSGRHPHLPALAWEGAQDLAIAHSCMDALGLREFAERSLETLSGGELRRVEIARLLAQQTGVTLLDEPMNHLDLGHQAAALRALREACVTPDRCMLMVLHDLNLAYHACDHWLILNADGSWQAGRRDDLAEQRILGAAFGHPIQRIDGTAGPLFLARL
ncbi:MAG: ABC transporter ATP-binding protein [Chromatiaceae bacterium]|nr:ABC transporter ATP-binding protein [Chromatiaceae bacterium]